MKHLGDITKLRGCDVPIVDCVIGGSPCQGLSNAGKRLGLDDERSGLYMEQIRITKEMREHDRIRRGADEPISPRYMVWENVPGAFSTGDPKWADFQAVLEEAIRIAEPEAPSIPIPPKGWNTSGCIVDGLGRWSLAWRVTDAQYWGVPQRRRRICMVVDFNGVTAPQIVFGDAEFQRSTASAGGDKAVGHLGAECGREISSVEDGLRGHLAESEPQREEAAASARSCADGENSYTLKIRGGCEGGGKGALIQTEKSATLSTLQDQTLFQPFCKSAEHHAVAYGISPFHSNAMMSGNPHSGIYEATTARSLDAALVVEQPMQTYQKVTGPLMANSHPGSYTGQDAFSDMLVAGADIRNATETPESVGPLQAAMNHNLNSNGVIRTGYIVRRLTPREAERLQGFPDNWTLIGEPVEKVVEEFDEDTGEKTGEHIEQEFYYINSRGKRVKASDSARYKALGNSISIPNWKYIIKRLCAHYERDATMASLFDGIGGFPYIWEQLNGKGSCLWASEIEEFPMAVTKLRFGE